MPPDHPLQDPAVLRLTDQSVKISWRFKSEPVTVKIFAGPSPELIDHTQPLAAPGTADDIVIDQLKSDQPYYFALAADNAPALITAERRVPLEGAVNFRDLGGYRTGDGKVVKWCQIFRSDNLARLSDRDLQILSHLKIASVCDFRTGAEIKRAPNRLAASNDLRYFHLPIQHGEHDPAAAFERIKNGDYQWLNEEFMARGYFLSLDNFAPLWFDFFNILASPERRPLLFHCTGGKDRTGTAAALILSVLGVPEETIVTDYAISAQYIAGVLKVINSQLEKLGVDPKEVAPYFTVTPGRIKKLFDHIRNTYGSAAQYLVNKAGIDPAVIEQLREDLLVGM